MIRTPPSPSACARAPEQERDSECWTLISTRSRSCCARRCAMSSARHCPLEVVRAMEDDPVGYPAALWTQLGELDLIGLLLPEEYGGSGMSLVEGVALYEELGRALAPTPHFVERGHERGRAGRRRERRPEGAVAAARRCRRGHPHAGLARARERVLSPRRGGAGRGRGLGIPAQRGEAPRRLRLGGRPARRAGPDRRRGRGRRPLPRRSRGERGGAAPAVQHLVRHPVRGHADRRRR